MAEAPSQGQDSEFEPLVVLPEPSSAEREYAWELNRWDRHVAQCRDCLVQGLELCAEGEYLTLRVKRSVTRLCRIRAKGERVHATDRPALADPAGR